MRPLHAALAVLAAFPLAACVTLGPDYARPELALPAGYSAGEPSGAVPDAWWTLFEDPALDALVGEALANNRDLAAAAARVDEARALAGLTRAERFPELSATASGTRSRFSEETSQLPPGFPLETTRIRAGAVLSFELDFWGRYRRASEATRAELLASEEGRRSVRLGLVAEMVTASFDLAALDHQLAVARETLATRQESARLQRVRVDAGTISELDLAQAEAELAATEATIPALERERRRTENRIAVLLGRVGGAVPPGRALEAIPLPEVPVGLPSDLLLRRPDVAAAEARLVAANARIGTAQAGYFPTISLTGSAGSESEELGGLFASGTGVYQAALQLLQPIFDAGRTTRRVEAARARERQAAAAWAKAVESAFAEVEDALAARRAGVAEREALARQVDALARARHLADLRYEAGESTYLEVLDAERSLFRAELDWVRARQAELTAAVTLFKALGGGWETPPPPASTSP